MTKTIVSCLLPLFSASSLMAASVLDAQYDRDVEQVTVQVAYCISKMSKVSPAAELQDDGMCSPTYPMSCEVALVVHNEAKRPKPSDTCLTERLVYHTTNVIKPADYWFRANDGSVKTAYVD